MFLHHDCRWLCSLTRSNRVESCKALDRWLLRIRLIPGIVWSIKLIIEFLLQNGVVIYWALVVLISQAVVAFFVILRDTCLLDLKLLHWRLFQLGARTQLISCLRLVSYLLHNFYCLLIRRRCLFYNFLLNLLLNWKRWGIRNNLLWR